MDPYLSRCPLRVERSPTAAAVMRKDRAHAASSQIPRCAVPRPVAHSHTSARRRALARSRPPPCISLTSQSEVASPLPLSLSLLLALPPLPMLTRAPPRHLRIPGVGSPPSPARSPTPHAPRPTARARSVATAPCPAGGGSPLWRRHRADVVVAELVLAVHELGHLVALAVGGGSDLAAAAAPIPVVLLRRRVPRAR